MLVEISKGVFVNPAAVGGVELSPSNGTTVILSGQKIEIGNVNPEAIAKIINEAIESQRTSHVIRNGSPR